MSAPHSGRSRRGVRFGVAQLDDEGHVSDERWLVTYADMITLLMVLFIILFAMSQVDQKKYDELRDGLMSGFGQTVLSGASPMSTTTEDSASSPADADVSAGSPASVDSSLTPAQQAQVDQAVQKTEAAASERTYGEAKTEVSNLLGIWRQMKAALQAQGLQSDVQATIDQRGLVVSLVSRQIIFPANLATLTPRGQRIVDTLAPVLAKLTQPIEVDGHTNQVPVKPTYYATDWDLSAARAITVLRRLQEQDGLPANRLSATGFGHTKPLVPVSTPDSQEINKRVDIVVLSQASDEAKTDFPGVLQALHVPNSPADGGLR